MVRPLLHALMRACHLRVSESLGRQGHKNSFKFCWSHPRFLGQLASQACLAHMPRLMLSSFQLWLCNEAAAFQHLLHCPWPGI